MTHRAIIRKHHDAAVKAAFRLARAAPFQRETLRKHYLAAKERFDRAVRRYLPKDAGGA